MPLSSKIHIVAIARSTDNMSVIVEVFRELGVDGVPMQASSRFSSLSRDHDQVIGEVGISDAWRAACSAFDEARSLWRFRNPRSTFDVMLSNFKAELSQGALDLCYSMNIYCGIGLRLL